MNILKRQIHKDREQIDETLGEVGQRLLMYIGFLFRVMKMFYNVLKSNIHMCLADFTSNNAFLKILV